MAERMDGLRKQLSEKEMAVIQANEENDKLQRKIADMIDRECELVSFRDEAEDRAEAAESEIIRLKAKLYDLLIEKEGRK